jgi:hypothetical protein
MKAEEMGFSIFRLSVPPFIRERICDRFGCNRRVRLSQNDNRQMTNGKWKIHVMCFEEYPLETYMAPFGDS